MSEGGLAVPHVCFGGRVLLLPWRRCLFVCAAAAGVLNGVCLPPGSVSFAFAGRQIYEVRCCAASVLTAITHVPACAAMRKPAKCVLAWAWCCVFAHVWLGGLP